MTFGSLFAGIGGMDLGLERAGMTCRWQVEIDEFCRKVLTKHWPEVPKYGDIRELTGDELEPVDLIAGGFPCQDLSVAGHRKGIDAARSGLWSHYHRLLGVLRPRFVLIENVSGLLVNEPMRRVLGDLSTLGFDAEWESIPAASVGAPIIRDRVFIFAFTGCKPWKPGEFFTGCVGDDLVSEGDYRFSSEWSTHRKLIRLVPGVHPRVASDWWRTQSTVARSTDGVPDRLQRIKGVGNAVSPKVAEWVGRRIMEAAK